MGSISWLRDLKENLGWTKRKKTFKKHGNRESRKRRLLLEHLEDRIQLSTVNVAVVGSGGSDDSGFQAIVNQLNDDTYFDFNAQLVQYWQVDTTAELNNYDVVVIGNNGASPDGDKFQFFAPALRTWVESGGGVVATGWTVYGAGQNSGAPVSDIDAVIPVNTSGYQNYHSETSVTSPTGPAHPITFGVSSFSTPFLGHVEFPSSPQVDSGAMVLGTTAMVLGTTYGQPTIVAGTPVSGRSVYLGPIYSSYAGFNTSWLRTGAPDRLLEQAVNWAAGNDAALPDENAPTVVSTTPADGGIVAEGFNEITVEFSEQVTAATAENVANYTLTGPQGSITIDSAVLDAGQTTVTLTFAEQIVGGEYELHVANISDLAGNVLTGGGYAAAMIRVTTRPYSSAVGDFTGDGIVDLIVNQDGYRNLVLYRGQPNGDLDNGTSILNITSGGYVKEMISADLNGDGRLDLVLAENEYGTGVYFGNGNGTFASRQAVSYSGRYVRSVSVGDVDNDGDLDIVSGEWYGQIIAHRNNGGAFPSWNQVFSSGPHQIDHHLADVNNDGRLDMLSVGSGVNTGYAHLGNGSGNFFVNNSFSTGHTSEHTALADIDDDGRLDLATGSYGVNITYGTGTSAPFFGSTQNLTSGNSFATNISAVDLAVMETWI